MLTFTDGNLFEGNHFAIVNTVNCVGVMGKGIALQFKKRYPRNFLEYKRYCDSKQLVPGTLHIHYHNDNPKYIINFPTKRHWRDDSRLDDIVSGLRKLKKFLIEYDIPDIGIPALGCTNGKLDWEIVREIIIKELEGVPTNITLYNPRK